MKFTEEELRRIEALPPVSRQAIREHFPAYIDEMFERMITGAEEYGDASFSRDPRALLREVRQEIVDKPTWGFISWVRTKALESALDEIEVEMEMGAP